VEQENAMINGAHVIINSTNPDADRTFLREVLGLPHVDVGHGWLIFGLPPAEVAVHPADTNGEHQLYFMCDDIEALIREMQKAGIECEKVNDLRWGLLTNLTLPGGGKLGIYEPRHERPKAMEPKK
jgi:catechol 2,3-dioxygenase-like lactoylglutathione lyase family enzyme